MGLKYCNMRTQDISPKRRRSTCVIFMYAIGLCSDIALGHVQALVRVGPGSSCGKFLIFVDDELEKEKREKGRKSERSEQKRRREGEREEESNTFPIKPCIWFLLELDPPVVAKIYCGAKRRMCSVLTSLTCMHQIAAASQKQTSQKYYMYQDTRVQGYVWI